MLSYIIPPIVIVLSLAALIFFLFRKSAKIAEELILKEKRNEIGGAQIEKQKLFRFTQFILKISEKIMQRFKLFSLRFYNKTDNWFHSIKEKRENRISNTPRPEKEEMKIGVDNISVRRDATRIEETEIEIEPMISKEAVHPDSRIQVRNEFEKALIERIAFNPKDIEAYERLGDYYIEIGNFNDSLACFEEVLKLSPGSRRAKIKTKRLQKIVFGGLSR
ncbi:MAG: tetratricopeptide repeat protein [Parcubacteria group bacterium]|jgi:tetratricopeptide (TPR) repeat protein